MIAHVAEAGEERGRVVLRLCASEPNGIALEAAIRVAQAFNAQIEGLFVEDEQLLALASLPFAREISLTGRQIRPLSPEAMELELRLAFAPARRTIMELARSANVPLTARVVRAERVAAVAEACSACGPWNVVAVAEPMLGLGAGEIARLISAVTDTTGLIVVGPQARRTSGPILIALEDSTWLPGMVRAAERLAGLLGQRIVLAPTALEPAERGWLEGEARLLLAERTDIEIVASEASGDLGALLARVLPGFLICQFGRGLVPPDDDLKALADALECPLFLVK